MKPIEIMEALTDLDDELVLLPQAQSKKTKSANVRWLKWTAAAAVAVMLTTVSAYAADAMFNDGAIAARISEKISDSVSVAKKSDDNMAVNHQPDNSGNKTNANITTKPPIYNPQEEVPDDQVQKSDGSVTSNGTTITPISAIHDGHMCYFRIRVEVPEGCVLEDLPDDKKYSVTGHSRDKKRVEVDMPYGHLSLYEVKVTVLSDEDPTDNVKEFVLELYSSDPLGFHGQNIRISIPGLWICGLSTSSSKNYYKKIFNGNFEFSVPVSRMDEKIKLKNIGKTLYIEEHDFSVNLEQIIVTPLRLEVHYTATLPENEDILPDGGYAQIVMKDGTRLTFGDLSNVSDGPDVGYQVLSKAGEYYGMNFEDVAREYNLDAYDKYGFEEPIVLKEIDYIVWCGGQIIDVN